MDIKLTLSDLKDLLNRLSVAYSIEQINKTLFQVHIWHNGSKFRLRFSRDEFEDTYSFSGWLDETTNEDEDIELYEELPDGYDFSTEFDTYILAYCPDTCSWFATNKRFFYYEYSKEFKSKEEAEKYFKQNAQEFYNLEIDGLADYRPSFYAGGVVLDVNSKNQEFIPVEKT